MSNEPRVFHPTNLGLTKEQIVDIVSAYTEEEDTLTVDDILDAQAEQFVCLYYDTLIDWVGRGDCADAVSAMIDDWLADRR